jgi:hypothetical protein
VAEGWRPVNGWLTYFTTDGSYLKLEIYADGSDWQKQNWYLYFPDGRRVVGRGDQVEALYDANGNAIRVANICVDFSRLRQAPHRHLPGSR